LESSTPFGHQVLTILSILSHLRKEFTDNEQLLLHTEVEGLCPLCSNELLYRKKNLFKSFEIAHIYPLNPTTEEEALLSKEERLSDDPNDLNNVICLCSDCHLKFDKPRTIQEYQLLLEKKKATLQRQNQKSLWHSGDLLDEVGALILHLSEAEEEDENDHDILEYDPKTIDDKVDSSISLLVKRKVHRNVADYYHVIRDKFKELDRSSPLTTEIISSQVKTHYLKLARHTSDQKIIFNGMVEWISRKTGNKSDEACEIVISYFIQNCEVFK
jgi:hypothetical protein